MQGQPYARLLGDGDDSLQEVGDVSPYLVVRHVDALVHRRAPEVPLGPPDLVVVEAGHLRAAPSGGGPGRPQPVVPDAAPQGEEVQHGPDPRGADVLDAPAPVGYLLVTARKPQLDLVGPVLRQADHAQSQARVLDPVP